MLIAAIGLFGLMSHSVARRTPEIGIRMALGAQSRDMLALVMSESMALVATGIALGIAGALAAGRLVSSLLFGLEAADTLSLVAAIGMMVVTAAVAGYVPARRAARIDPMIALRRE